MLWNSKNVRLANSYKLCHEISSETDEERSQTVFSRKARILYGVTDCKKEWHLHFLKCGFLLNQNNSIKLKIGLTNDVFLSKAWEKNIFFFFFALEGNVVKLLLEMWLGYHLKKKPDHFVMGFSAEYHLHKKKSRGKKC